jgi:hypothetical protein
VLLLCSTPILRIPDNIIYDSAPNAQGHPTSASGFGHPTLHWYSEPSDASGRSELTLVSIGLPRAGRYFCPTWNNCAYVGFRPPPSRPLTLSPMEYRNVLHFAVLSGLGMPDAG